MKRYSKKNDKSFNNDRMNVRDMTNLQVKMIGGMNDHSKNLDRMAMERNFARDSREVDTIDANDGFGEITGTRFEEGTDNKGLPLRGQYHIKKQMYDNNNHFDFNLFDR